MRDVVGHGAWSMGSNFELRIANFEFEKAQGRLEIVDFLSEKGEICLQGTTGAKLWITSLNSHFPHHKPQPKMLKRKKRSQGLRSFFNK